MCVCICNCYNLAEARILQWRMEVGAMDACEMEVLWAPEDGATTYPCVDCGLNTGNFCDGVIAECYAADRVPHDYAKMKGFGRQRTPLCSYCETRFEVCRFCRGVASCTPPCRQFHWSGVPMNLSRDFDEAEADRAVSKEWRLRAEIACMQARANMTDCSQCIDIMHAHEALEAYEAEVMEGPYQQLELEMQQDEEKLNKFFEHPEENLELTLKLSQNLSASSSD